MVAYRRHGAQALLALAVVAAVPAVAWGQVFVYPRRPNQSQVRYYGFDWRHVDILVGPEADTSGAHDLQRRISEPVTQPPTGTGPHGLPTVLPQGEIAQPGPLPPAQEGEGTGDKEGAQAPPLEPDVLPPAEPGALDEGPFNPRTLGPQRDPTELLGARAGGVRLFFYEREREVAERAAALIVESYVYLVGQFEYVPTKTFPYILYSSYQEFLQTNLFPLQEGTLGVTSPVDLKLTLPYFGDHQLFADVSAHELAHQFTIQKVRTATEAAKLWGEPLGALPLWFIEGLAEYYAKHGIDPEAEMLVRDLVINPDFELGFVLLDFFEDRPWSFLWTYKMGQVRCAFLEETYGKGTVQRVLEQSPRLVGVVGGQPALDGFATLVSRVTGDRPRQISARFESWLKKRAYRSYLASAQSSPAVEPIEDLGLEFVDALRSSPSGNLLLLRGFDPVTGRSRLSLLDWRAPRTTRLVAIDGLPGVESLHPVWGRNFDLSDRGLAYVAQSKGADVLYWQQLDHQARPVAKAKLLADKLPHSELPTAQVESPATEAAVGVPKEAWVVRLRLGKRQKFDLGKKGLIAAYSPVFSPDGSRVALIGFHPNGLRDVYVLEPDAADPDGFRLTRLTDDEYSERHLAWGPEGIVFTSDATAHGRYNLFRVRPEAPLQVERLTTEPRDHHDPTVLADGRVLFTAFDRGRGDIHEVQQGEVVRRTDIATGLFDLSPGPGGSVWALHHRSGRRRPVRILPQRLLTLETLPQPEAAPPRELVRRPLHESVPYLALSPRNWELGPPFGFIGAGAGGIVGQVVASAADKLRNHALLLNVSVLGSFELTDGYLVYLNQERRITWGTGVFQSLVFRQDQTFEDFQRPSAERFYGGLGSLRYPFNRFVYLQGDISVGGVSYFLFPSVARQLSDPAANPSGENLLPRWYDQNRGPRFQTEATVRVGYDTIRYAGGTGPIAGSSLMVEGSTAYQPFHDEVFGTVRLDGERYFPIWGRTHLFLRGGSGTTFGGRLARQFYLSSFDTLRGIPYGETDWLIGRHFLFSTAELQIPLNSIIRLLIVSDIEAVAGLDFGGVGQSAEEIWDRRVLAPVVGVNFGLGPLVLRLHFARPLDIRAPAGLPVRQGEWVTNFSIRILGFEGLFSQSPRTYGPARF